MAGNQDGFPLIFQIQQQFADFADAAVIQPVHGFIQNQQRWIFHDRLRDAQALAHAHGIFAHPFAAGGIQPYGLNGAGDFIPTDHIFDSRKQAQIGISAVAR